MKLEKEELIECENCLKKMRKRKNIVDFFDKFAMCGGVMSFVCLAISPVALIPLAGFVGTGIYTNNKSKKCENEIYELYTEWTKLNSECFKASKKSTSNEVSDNTNYNLQLDNNLNKTDEPINAYDHGSLVKTRISK